MDSPKDGERTPQCERDAMVFMAKVAEQAERWEGNPPQNLPLDVADLIRTEMVDFMRRVISLGSSLSVEERNLFSIAFKNVTSERRAAWRILAGSEQRALDTDHRAAKMAATYRHRVEEQARAVCYDALSQIAHLLSATTTSEARVFYLKMRGDYYRYVAEMQAGDERRDSMVLSIDAYDRAQDVVSAEFPATHHTRLGLALSFATFAYEVLGQPERAVVLAKRAFDDAISELDRVPEEHYKDVTLVMQLLRDNLTLWTKDCPEERPSKLP